jgi:hypothetical protein
MTANASAQMPMPSVHLGGEQKRPLTPEEKERQKQLDDDYKAATNKTPDQKANDPWASFDLHRQFPPQKRSRNKLNLSARGPADRGEYRQAAGAIAERISKGELKKSSRGTGSVLWEGTCLPGSAGHHLK